jgi:hypothetical protein
MGAGVSSGGGIIGRRINREAHGVDPQFSPLVLDTKLGTPSLDSMLNEVHGPQNLGYVVTQGKVSSISTVVVVGKHAAMSQPADKSDQGRTRELSRGVIEDLFFGIRVST